jgi:hypothetical protein
VKIVYKEDGQWLPCSRGKELVSKRLGDPSWSMMGLEPIWYDARILMKDNKG